MLVATTTAEEVRQQLAQESAHNAAIFDTTLWQWEPLGTNTGTKTPQWALEQTLQFSLENASGFIRRFRIWLQQLQINVSEGTGTNPNVIENRGGIWSILGRLRLALGNDVYRVRASAIPLIALTFQKRGLPFHYTGDTTYNYSSSLYGSVNGSTVSNGVLTDAGTNVFTGYLDIPTTLLEKVKDADGIMPTLSTAGVSLSLEIPNAISGADAYAFPFNSEGGSTVSIVPPTTSQQNVVAVFAEMARFKSMVGTANLPQFIAGPAFVIEENTYALQSTDESFFTFQGQSANSSLVKSIVVIRSPGETYGEFANNDSLQRLELMYDRTQRAVSWTQTNNPNGNEVPLPMFFIAQREKYGDLPPGVLVFDFASGTDPSYPNSHDYIDLDVFKNAGINIQYSPASGSLEPNSQLTFINIYLNPTFYVAQG